MTDRAAEARAEAERRNPLPECCDGVETHCRWHRQVERLREEFEEGRRWADANPKPHTITYREFERAYLRGAGGDLEWDAARKLVEALGIEVEDHE